MVKFLYKFFFFRYYKRFLFGLSGAGGRNFLGRICVYHQGGGNKRRLRLVDRFRRLEQYGFLLKVLKGSSKLPYFGFILYDNGVFSLIFLADGVGSGARLFSGTFFRKDFFSSFSKVGSSILLNHMHLFSTISSLESYPHSGFKLVRAAGTSARIVAKLGGSDKMLIKLSSGWLIRVSLFSMAVLGPSSNKSHNLFSVGKAGISRACGVRPTVRGVAKNPCDHPHGGGEGRGSPPAAAVSPWGFLTKGTPTKNKKFQRLKRRLFKSS